MWQRCAFPARSVCSRAAGRRERPDPARALLRGRNCCRAELRRCTAQAADMLRSRARIKEMEYDDYLEWLRQGGEAMEVKKAKAK
eukprot:587386-Prymnesium_polylepis.1